MSAALKLTNNFKLPQTLMNAIERDPYSMGDARMSITGLLRPPRITLLTKRHSSDIESDVTDHIWSLFGRAIHTILESGGDEEHLTEERLYAEVRGWRISGAMDLQRLQNNTVAITDYKSCSVYAVLNEKPAWEEQLNSYRWLLETAKPDYKVSRLAICAFMRDWSRREAARKPDDYPQAPAVVIAVPMWPMESATKFIHERVKAHQQAIADMELGNELPHCTDEERWMRPDKWAIRQIGGQRATKVFDTEAAAKEFFSNSFAVRAREIVHRPGEPIRCTGNYCGVAPWCKQYAQWTKERP